MKRNIALCIIAVTISTSSLCADPDLATEPQMRLKLKLQPAVELRVKDRTGRIQTQSRISAPREYNLRSRLSRAHHFYISDFHIQSTPQRNLAKPEHVSIRLQLYKTFGPNRDMEEYLGETTVQAKLIKTKPDLYHAVADHQAEFKRSNGEVVLKLSAGYSSEDFSKNPGLIATKIEENAVKNEDSKESK